MDCAMRDKFKANIRIVAPAVLLVFVIYIIKGAGVDAVIEPGAAEPVKLLPYLLVLVLALAGMDVLLILSLGIAVNLLIGLFTGSLGWTDWLASVGEGIGGMGSLIIVTVMAGGMMALIRAGGGLDYLVSALTSRLAPAPGNASASAPASGCTSASVPSLGSASVSVDASAPTPGSASASTSTPAAAPSRRQRRGAELSIAALVSLANLCTANNTIAIITVGGIAKDIADRFSLDRKRVASILDTFSCFVQGLIPYGAQLLMASGLAGVGAAAIIRYLYYPFALGLVALAAILLPSFRRH